MIKNKIARAVPLLVMYGFFQLSQVLAILAAGALIAGDWLNDRLYR